MTWQRILRDHQSRSPSQPQPGVIGSRAQERGRFLMTKRPPETTLHQNPRSPRSQTTTDLRQEAQNFLHDCDRSARYHTHRRTFFDWCHRWMMVAVLVSGSSAVAILSGAFSSEVRGGGVMLSIIIMLIPTTVGAISVVWNLTDRARDHGILARRFYQIAKSINVEEADPERIEDWRIEILGASQEEPAVFYALNAECYNAATRALGYGDDRLQQISRWRYYLRNWVRFSAGNFPLMRGANSS